MRYRLLLGLLFLIAFERSTQAQDTDILLNHDLYHYIDRLDIKGYADTAILTFHKPYGRAYLREIFGQVSLEEMSPTEAAWHARMRMLADDGFAGQEQFKGVRNLLFTNHRDLFALEKPGFRLYVNPAVHFAGGLDQNNYPDAFRESLPLSINTRGLVIRGSVKEKLGFYTEVSENITRFPFYIYEDVQATEVLYGEGFIKPFGQETGLDYLGSRAYLTFSPFDFVRIKFGKDRAFWGNGWQSLQLSDHAADYLFLNINTRIWKLEYSNHFTQMIDYLPGKTDAEGTFPRKYGVFHQLNFQPNQRFSIGFFESVIYANQIGNRQRGLELQYFNPVIFFRAAEQYVGSPDNALLGLQLKWNFLKRFQFYGQLLLDDYNFGRRDEGDGYWQNKIGFQTGLKYIDVLGISTLDLQVEYNRVRPYAYQHFNLSTNYTHYNQNLGHASGANLSDIHFILRYHPAAAWNFLLTYSSVRQGLDQNGINYGGNPLSPDLIRAGDFDQFVGQGLANTVQQAYLRVSRQLWNADLYAEVEARYRQENDLQSAMILGGLRWHIQPRLVKF
ncbi:MAG: capsule assembly Wzi family protein [Bacteroidota bacterium]